MPSASHSSPATFPHLIDAQAATPQRDRVFLQRRRARVAESTTFGALIDEVNAVARGLLARGLTHGDRVGLISENRAEWLVADLACASIGIVDVPRGTDTALDELLFILGHSGCRFAFVETDAVARDLLERRDALPELQAICVLESTTTVDGVLTLPDLIAHGTGIDDDRLDRARARVTPEDLLTIVYTSGTTADPKGVMLTHGNLTSDITAVRDVLHFDHDDVFLSVLPAWHAYERIMNYVAFACGSQIAYTDRRGIKDDLKAVRPTAFAAVPRIWESIHDGIVNHCHKQKPPMRGLLKTVLRTCRDVGARRAGPVTKILHAVFRRTIVPKFLGATGGRMRIAVSGGGSLPDHVDHCLLGMGLPLLNGYGLTETSPVAAVRVPEDNRAGTIGRPLPRTRIEIRDEAGDALPTGEIGIVWIRGPQVMRGYYKNDERTRQVLDHDGWFNSGDLGCIDADGHVRITGRAKDTIVLAGGENVEPERVETVLKTSPLIDQAIVLGQDEKHLGAIVVPMLEVLEQRVSRDDWGRREDGTLTGESVQRLVRAEIDRLIRRENGFRPVERIAHFRVVEEPLTIENGLLTQTLKVKRHKVREHHRPLIHAMFK